MTTRYDYEQSIRNVCAYYDLATRNEKREGGSWYSNAYKYAYDLAHDYNVPLAKVIGVLAALSPRNRWETNKTDCERFVRAYSLGHDLESLKSHTYKANKEKAIYILELDFDEDILVQGIKEILHGNKTVSFFYNILLPCEDSESVTIDSHAYGVALGNGDRVKPKGLTNNQYKQLVEIYQAASLRINNRDKTNFYPSDIQAITWLVYKRVHNI